MGLLKIIFPNSSLKFLTFYHLVGIILIFSQVNISRSKGSVYFENSTNIKYDYISDVIRRYKRQNLDSGVNCELPSNPLHGRYAVLGDSVTNYIPGNFASQYISLELKCNRGYAIRPFERNITICRNGSWSPPPTDCLRTCPSLMSTETTTVICILNTTILENCINPVNGTRATLSCNPLYEEPNIQKNPIRVCRRNQWYPATSTCYPTCGNKKTDISSNIIGGQNVTIGDYPWQIGIYYSSSKEFLCGGSIIALNIILTAAHCVTDHNGVVQPTAQYCIAAGKSSSIYNEPRDEFAQYSNITTIHVPTRYRGIINGFALDIAVLILDNHFTLSEAVQPICIALNDDPSDVTFISAGDNGVITGWGYTTENGRKASEILKRLTIPIISFEKCSSELPQGFNRYYTHDKICAGYINTSSSVCKGDSGSALVFKNFIDNRYYVRGVESGSPTTEALLCDSNHYSLYTSVKEHMLFVRNILIDNNQFLTPIECLADNCQTEENQGDNNQVITSINCQIPNYGPHVRRYTILSDSGNAYKTPGDDVQQYSTLEIVCDPGYKPNVFSNLHTTCVNGKWSPSLSLRCLRTCPSLNSTASTSVTCKYLNVHLNSCQNPIEETTALLLCNPFYEDALQNNVIRTCTAGSWIPAISECHAMCGVKRPKGRLNIINGQNATMGDYPWQVGIYNQQREFICGGSILDRHIVLTVADCFTNYDGQVRPFENYLIAAGKYYSQYEDDRDEFAQYSKVLQIYVPKRYRGLQITYANDIAMILLTDPFTISEVVQPVCIQLNKESPFMHLSLNSSGIITGWGHTQEGGEISDVLKELVVPIIPFDKCFEEVPKSFQRYITADKICAGYLNNGTSICRGDGGGSLVLKNILTERYYVEGIVSVSATTVALVCDSNQYSLYTSIKEHIDFIKNYLEQHKIPQTIEFVAEEATN